MNIKFWVDVSLYMIGMIFIVLGSYELGRTNTNQARFFMLIGLVLVTLSSL